MIFIIINFMVILLAAIDIDECDDNTHGCHLDASCINQPGSYECICNPQYTGDGFNCECMQVYCLSLSKL